ncbi:MAG: hypothetical protein QW579_00970 [Desulfurococcaceae archaeon]
MVKCPFCGFESDASSFKQLREPWKFRFYEVKMLECPRCKNVFNYYEGVSSRGKQSSFTIRVKPRTRETVEAYGKARGASE